MNRPVTILGLLVMAAIAVPLDRYFGRHTTGVIWEVHIPFEPHNDDELDRINSELKFSILANAKKARRGVPCVLDAVMSQAPRAK